MTHDKRKLSIATMKAFEDCPALVCYLQEPANILIDAHKLQRVLGEIRHMGSSSQQCDSWVLQDLKRVCLDAVRAHSPLGACSGSNGTVTGRTG